MEALKNIAASIGVVLEPGDACTEVIFELILQGMLELENKERDLLYFRYGLNMDEFQIGKLMGMTNSEILKQSFEAKQKLEKVLKGTR